MSLIVVVELDRSAHHRPVIGLGQRLTDRRRLNAPRTLDSGGQHVERLVARESLVGGHFPVSCGDLLDEHFVFRGIHGRRIRIGGAGAAIAALVDGGRDDIPVEVDLSGHGGRQTLRQRLTGKIHVVCRRLIDRDRSAPLLRSRVMMVVKSGAPSAWKSVETTSSPSAFAAAANASAPPRP